MDYDVLCRQIMESDKKVRFAGVCDETGDIICGGQREGIENILSTEETRRSNLQALARWGLRNALAPRTGKGKYAMAEYEKIKRITLPLDENHLLYITTEVGCDAHNLIDKVRKL